ncbi:MAG: glycoside hydrolase family 43 protein [Verrucomicrobia bacterium]|nr:glycoside hydrolase family 43 protein [Verrucomicrobiota bacterium]MCF7707321.1 glycoside hydrolase family 43 protein [Verrucomicrobiota bacterium]
MPFALAWFFFVPVVNSFASDEDQFLNPVVEKGADPWVIFQEGEYYYCFSSRNRIWIARAGKLHEIGRAEKKAVWNPPPDAEYSRELWAPELHLLDGKWYIYVAADDGDNYNHSMYALERADADPLGPFTFKGKVAAPPDKWAIDGTVLEMGGLLYFIWSGWEGNVNVRQNLYIAPMSNPWTICGERVLISRPVFDWEKHGDPLVNEGPEVLKKDGKVFIVYSASGSWTDHYCLGMLTLSGTEPLKPGAWKKHPEPVFESTEDVIAPGHASFVHTTGGEDWIVYHAAKYSGAGWNRNVRMQRIHWSESGLPVFGAPVSTNMPLDIPE